MPSTLSSVPPFHTNMKKLEVFMRKKVLCYSAFLMYYTKFSSKTVVNSLHIYSCGIQPNPGLYQGKYRIIYTLLLFRNLFIVYAHPNAQEHNYTADDRVKIQSVLKYYTRQYNAKYLPCCHNDRKN